MFMSRKSNGISHELLETDVTITSIQQKHPRRRSQSYLPRQKKTGGMCMLYMKSLSKTPRAAATIELLVRLMKNCPIAGPAFSLDFNFPREEVLGEKKHIALSNCKTCCVQVWFPSREPLLNF